MRAARTTQKAVAETVGDKESEVLCGCFESIEVDRAGACAKVEIESLGAGG